MIERVGDLWKYHEAGNVIIIPNCGTLKGDSSCVMGTGLARQAADRFPDLPYTIGRRFVKSGVAVYYLPRYRLIVFPVIEGLSQEAYVDSLRLGYGELKGLMNKQGFTRVYSPKIGCDPGSLTWGQVRRIMEEYGLGDVITIIDNKG